MEHEDLLTAPSMVEPKRAIEAILLVASDPTPTQLLAQLIELPVDHVEQLCRELALGYDMAGHGFQLVEVAGGWRYQTHPDMAPYVERFAMDGQSTRLSTAALETLSIVAYKQPISRAQVSAIRGVNVDAVLRTLVQRGYVEEVGRDLGPGQAILYGTTQYFLERVGLNETGDLPPLGDFVPSAEVVEALEQTLKVEVDVEPELVIDAEEATPDTADEPAAERDGVDEPAAAAEAAEGSTEAEADGAEGSAAGEAAGEADAEVPGEVAVDAVDADSGVTESDVTDVEPAETDAVEAEVADTGAELAGVEVEAAGPIEAGSAVTDVEPGADDSEGFDGAEAPVEEGPGVADAGPEPVGDEPSAEPELDEESGEARGQVVADAPEVEADAQSDDGPVGESANGSSPIWPEGELADGDDDLMDVLGASVASLVMDGPSASEPDPVVVWEPAQPPAAEPAPVDEPSAADEPVAVDEPVVAEESAVVDEPVVVEEPVVVGDLQAVGDPEGAADLVEDLATADFAGLADASASPDVKPDRDMAGTEAEPIVDLTAEPQPDIDLDADAGRDQVPASATATEAAADATDSTAGTVEPASDPVGDH